MKKKTKPKIKIKEIKRKIKIVESPKNPEKRESALEKEVKETSEVLHEEGTEMLEQSFSPNPVSQTPSQPIISQQTSALPSTEEKESKQVDYWTSPSEQAEEERKYEPLTGETRAISLSENETELRPITSQSEFESFTENSLSPPIRTTKEHTYPREEEKYKSKTLFKKKKIDMY